MFSIWKKCTESVGGEERSERGGVFSPQFPLSGLKGLGSRNYFSADLIDSRYHGLLDQESQPSESGLAHNYLVTETCFLKVLGSIHNVNLFERAKLCRSSSLEIKLKY